MENPKAPSKKKNRSQPEAPIGGPEVQGFGFSVCREGFRFCCFRPGSDHTNSQSEIFAQNPRALDLDMYTRLGCSQDPNPKTHKAKTLKPETLKPGTLHPQRWKTLKPLPKKNRSQPEAPIGGPEVQGFGFSVCGEGLRFCCFRPGSDHINYSSRSEIFVQNPRALCITF